MIAHGADVNAVGRDSYCGLHISAKRGDYDCLSALLDCNASTSIKTNEGQTAIDIATSKGNEDIYNRLMNHRPLLQLHPGNNSLNARQKSAANIRAEVDAARLLSQQHRPMNSIQPIPLPTLLPIHPSVTLRAPSNTVNRSNFANDDLGQGRVDDRLSNDDGFSGTLNNASSTAEDVAISALRRVLELEQKDRKAAEIKVRLKAYFYSITNSTVDFLY